MTHAAAYNRIELAARNIRLRVRERIELMIECAPCQKQKFLHLQARINFLIEAERQRQRRNVGRDYESELEQIFITQKEIEL